MDTDPGRAGLLAVWETGLMRAARNRLRAEGRLSRDWGISPEKAVDRGRRRREDPPADLDADQIITGSAGPVVEIRALLDDGFRVRVSRTEHVTSNVGRPCSPGNFLESRHGPQPATVRWGLYPSSRTVTLPPLKGWASRDCSRATSVRAWPVSWRLRITCLRRIRYFEIFLSSENRADHGAIPAARFVKTFFPVSRFPTGARSSRGMVVVLRGDPHPSTGEQQIAKEQA
jgi:hypothetical protein